MALESFGLKTHDDLLDVARLWAADDESFVPEYLISEASSEQPRPRRAAPRAKE